MEQKITTCLMKDDISGFLLAYRKLVSIDCDIIGVQTAYDRRNRHFLLTQDFTQHFDKIASIGPVPIYEDYITMANYPHSVNLNDYIGNIFNMDIISHLKKHHIEEIYPNQKTIYHPKLNVNKEHFLVAKQNINYDRFNVLINIYDSNYDTDFNLFYDMLFCLNYLKKEIKIPIRVYNAGIIHEAQVTPLKNALDEELSRSNFSDIDVVNISGESFSTQIGYMLHSDIVLSGSYGMGFLAYMVRAPSCIIFPYNLVDLMGKTIAPDRNTTDWYLETMDEDISANLDNMLCIARRAYDRNRNSNI